MWLGVHPDPRAVAQESNIVDWDNNIAEDYPEVFGDAVNTSVKICCVKMDLPPTQSVILSFVRILSATSSCTPSVH
jgi:hypothetical protein